jgi:hypothetical protein
VVSAVRRGLCILQGAVCSPRLRNSALSLGYDIQRWPSHERDGTNSWDPWHKLSTTKQVAAGVLGFTSATWNQRNAGYLPSRISGCATALSHPDPASPTPEPVPRRGSRTARQPLPRQTLEVVAECVPGTFEVGQPFGLGLDSTSDLHAR